MREQPYDPILVYKQQGVDQGLDSQRMTCCCVFKQNFKKMLPNKIVCVDSTHSTTMYDFQLVLLMTSMKVYP